MVEVVTVGCVEVVVELVVLVVVFVVFVVVVFVVLVVFVVTDVFIDVDLVVLVVDALWVELLNVVDLPCIPRTLGTVPIVAVCCASRVRVTSRMLTRVRLACSSDFQLMATQRMICGEHGKHRVTPLGEFRVTESAPILQSQSIRPSKISVDYLNHVTLPLTGLVTTGVGAIGRPQRARFRSFQQPFNVFARTRPTKRTISSKLSRLVQSND